MPAIFSRIHPQLRTPYLSSLTIGIVAAAIAALGQLDVVENSVNIGTLPAFTLVSTGVIILRRRQPDMKRGFRVPFSPVGPALSVLGASYITWLLLGLIVYFTHSRRRSELAGTAG